MIFLASTSFTCLYTSLFQFYRFIYYSVFSFFLFWACFTYGFTSYFYFYLAATYYFFCSASATFFSSLFSPGLLILKASNLILDLMVYFTFSSYAFCVIVCFREFIFCLFFQANPLDNVSCSSSFSGFYTFYSIFLLLFFSIVLSFFF